MHKLILIERDPPSYSSWPSLIKKKQFPKLSVAEVVNKYQGFAGEPVCFFEIKKNTTKVKDMIDECLEFKKLGSCFILYIFSEPDTMPNFLKNQFIKLGYDVGVCEQRKTIYSSIFHEIIFGYFDELIFFKNQLNENFLFPTKPLAEQYVRVHDELSAQGKGVEDYEKMVIYEIWKHKE